MLQWVGDPLVCPSPKRVSVPLSSQLPLETSPRSAADARRWVSEICRALEREDLVECAELGVSELVANAILHGEHPMTVRVRGTATHPRIEVLDGSTLPPVPASQEPEETTDLLLTFGRGLAIVARCATASGASIEDWGKIVWFEPATEISDGHAGAWLVDQRTSETQVPLNEAAVPVSLLGVHVDTFIGLVHQYSELRRELRLLSLAHHSDYPLAGDLSAMFASFERQFPSNYYSQIEAAASEGHDTVDLHYKMVPEAIPIFVTMREMFDVADAFCHAQRLLSLARTPEQRSFHGWMLDELVRQLGGAEPRRWYTDPGSTQDPPSASSTRVG